MRSPKGFCGTLVLLALVPLAGVYQLAFAAGLETFLHIACSISLFLVVEIYRIGSGTNVEALKLGSLFPIFWLMVESRKSSPVDEV